MSRSTFLAASRALVAIFTPALPDAFQVGVGAVLNAEADLLIVAYDNGEEPALSGGRSGSDASSIDGAETYDITCLLTGWTGDDDVESISEAVVGYYDAISDALDTAREGDSEIGVDGLLSVAMGEFHLRHPISGQGAVASLLFTVHIEAWRPS